MSSVLSPLLRRILGPRERCAFGRPAASARRSCGPKPNTVAARNNLSDWHRRNNQRFRHKPQDLSPPRIPAGLQPGKQRILAECPAQKRLRLTHRFSRGRLLRPRPQASNEKPSCKRCGGQGIPASALPQGACLPSPSVFRSAHYLTENRATTRMDRCWQRCGRKPPSGGPQRALAGNHSGRAPMAKDRQASRPSPALTPCALLLEQTRTCRNSVLPVGTGQLLP